MTFIDWIRSHPCEVVGFALLITVCLAVVAEMVMSFIRDKHDEMLSRGWSSPEEVAELGRDYRAKLIKRLEMAQDDFLTLALVEEGFREDLRHLATNEKPYKVRVDTIRQIIEMIRKDDK